MQSDNHGHADGALARLGQVLALARLEIAQGRFQRTMAIIAAFSAIVSGFEAYMQHLRGAFSHWLMWTPVWLTPPVVVAGGAAVASEKVARRVLPVISLVTLADGVVGFIYHLRGISRMPGGFRIGQYNIVMGPPVFAPLLMCSVGVLGTLAAWLRREAPPTVLRATQPSQPGVRPRQQDLPPGRLVEDVADDVEHGRFQQGLALVAAFFAVLAGGEAYFEHLRGSFNQRLMWTPVWVTPPMVAAGIGAARSARLAHRVLPAMSVVTFLDGLLGFFLHLRGMRRMPGRYSNLQFNLMIGPPLFAPLLFCSVGLLGVVAALLRRAGGGR